MAAAAKRVSKSRVQSDSSDSSDIESELPAFPVLQKGFRGPPELGLSRGGNGTAATGGGQQRVYRKRVGKKRKVPQELPPALLQMPHPPAVRPNGWDTVLPRVPRHRRYVTRQGPSPDQTAVLHLPNITSHHAQSGDSTD